MPYVSQRASLRVDIFCAVIDNFGDVGVCWRLARQLANEHGCAVRLWLDRPEVLALLLPAMRQGRQIEGVWIDDWQQAELAEPVDVVIEAFACNPPSAYILRMARQPLPAWINLEYLSAEEWIEDSHLMPSKHPELGINKYFYFPGFTSKTGGLLKEGGLDTARGQFQADVEAQRQFWRACGMAMPQQGALSVSLFAYENAALPALLDAWAAGEHAIHCAVPLGRPLPAIAAWWGEDLRAGEVVERGNLCIAAVPFLSQSDYDRLLWACDLNFVRGEDSFVRAQWAQRPFVWHIYQQDENAHRIKLKAFLGRFLEGLSIPAQQALSGFWDAWEMQEGAAGCWPVLARHLPELRRHAGGWAERVAAHGDLCSKLLIFCKDLVE
jgi:uncharacterized repeat protein (TIGR03837 family)